MEEFVKVKQRLCVVYCRVSAGSQLEGGGLNSQLTSCKTYCDRFGFKIVKYFEDGAVSGGILDRPGIKKLFNFVDEYNRNNEEKISLFLVDDIERIARDVQVHWTLKQEIVRRNMEFQTVKQKFEDTPMGHFIETIMAAKAQLFREDNKVRVISRQEARLIDGYRPFDYPVGFKTIKAPVGGKLLVKDEPNASIITEALEGYANGLFNTQDEVAEFLEEKGLNLERRSKKKVKYGINKVHISLVGAMLRNILYAGYIEYNKTTRDRKTGLVKNVWNISRRKGKHEGMISLETYEKIQLKLNNKKPQKIIRKAINDEFPLRNFLYCDCCELPLSSGISKKNNKQGYKPIPYYSFNKKCVLKGKSINAEKIHIAFEEVIKAISIDEKLINFIKLLFDEEYQETINNKKQVRKKIDSQLLELDNQINNLVDTLTTSQSEIVRKKIESKIEEIELQKQSIKHQYPTEGDMNLQKNLDIAMNIFRNPYKIRKEGNIDEKRLFLQLVFRNKILVNKKNGPFLTLPFSALFQINRDILDKQLVSFGDDRYRAGVGKPQYIVSTLIVYIFLPLRRIGVTRLL